MTKAKCQIWALCGAGRGVGKTTIAQSLVDILYLSTYAKCGHNMSKQRKPEPFFSTMEELNSFIADSYSDHEHIIIESNAYALTQNPDHIIYIDGCVGITDFRDDCEKLKSLSDIQICANSTIEKWKNILRQSINDKELIQPICDLFQSQKRYLFGVRPDVRSKVWFEMDGKHIFGKGLAKLLDSVTNHKTLRSAAENAGISYRKALKLISSAENALDCKLITRFSGGTGGGTSELSGAGKNLLSAYKQMNNDVTDYADRRFGKFLKTLNDAGVVDG